MKSGNSVEYRWLLFDRSAYLKSFGTSDQWRRFPTRSMKPIVHRILLIPPRWQCDTVNTISVGHVGES
ncbi:MAG: hypothetical protein GWP41_02710 [Planctomycetia bacterium]|nr:hypothetical protein [Planctomycetia bacterium]